METALHNDKQNDYDKEIILDNKIYKLYRNENKTILKTFDDEYNMWVTLEFPINGCKEANDLVVKTLTNTYIENHFKANSQQ